MGAVSGQLGRCAENVGIAMERDERGAAAARDVGRDFARQWGRVDRSGLVLKAWRPECRVRRFRTASAIGHESGKARYVGLSGQSPRQLCRRHPGLLASLQTKALTDS